jgi:hypothetical protein
MAIPRNLANIAPHVNASSTELVVNDGGANLDFRVEGDTDANTLFVDAGNDRVGVLTNSPSGKLDISYGADTNVPAILFGADANAFGLTTRTNNIQHFGTIGGVPYTLADGLFNVIGYDGLSGANSVNIGGVTSGLKGATQILFCTAANTTSTATERMRVNSSGQFLYNITSAASNIYFNVDNITPPAQFVTNSTSAYSGMSIINYSAGAYGGTLTIGTSQSDTKGTNALTTNTGPIGNINFVGNDGTNFRTCAFIRANIDGTSGSGDMPGRLSFWTTPDGSTTGSERVRITSGGSLGILNGSDGAGSNTLGLNSPEGASSTTYFILANHTATSTLNNTGTGSFRVATNGNVTNTNGSYGTISDIKLKQDIVDASSQWDDIKNLRFRKYRLKSDVEVDPNAKPLLGLVAQEAELVSPGLIEEHQDTEEVTVPEVDDEGNPILDDEGNPKTKTKTQKTGTTTKSIKTSVLYMKAVKALQEAITRIETLEAEVAALKAK